MSVNVIFNRSFAISYNVCTKDELQDMWRRSFGKIGTIYKGIQYEIVEA